MRKSLTVKLIMQLPISSLGTNIALITPFFKHAQSMLYP